MMLSRKPQHITEHLWYYEEKRGILIVHEIRDNEGKYIRTDQITIPWRKLRNSLKRKDSSY